MTQLDSERIQWAEWHLSMASVYRADAVLLLERQSAHSAGTLLYESAKQCLNAVANRRGYDPVYTRQKMEHLGVIGMLYPDIQSDLENGWRASMSLHIHADRGSLTEEEFHEYWLLSQLFIDTMLEIYEEEGY